MEQTVSEIPPSQEQSISQHHGTVNGSGAHLEQDPVERGYPGRWTGPRRGAHNGSFGGGHRKEKVQVPICLDNLKGKCTRGAFCRYQHSDDHDGSRFSQNERERLGTVASLGNSEFRVNGDSDSTTRFSRGCRNRSPCRRFQSGMCYRGASCPYLHPEMSSFDKSIHDSRVEHQQVDRELRDPGFGMRNGDNFVRLSQERVEANKENNSRNMSFSGEWGSTSPCQHFLRGKCDFGESCKRWHPVNTFVSSRHDLSVQPPQRIAATSSYPGSVPRSQDVTVRTSHEHMPDVPVNQQALQLQSSLRGAVPNSSRKLLILDVNGLLVDIVAGPIACRKPDTMIATKAVFKRPFCYNFLQFCFERFDMGIWSSRTKKNLIEVVDFLMKNTKNRLLFCWDQSHCTDTGYKTLENKEKPVVLKELRYLWWDNKWQSLPWDMGYYNETNTILLDDSPYKALRNPPYTAIFPHPYSYKNANDNSLGPGGDLRVYLERLVEAENVQKFILENPFGQRPISCSDKAWHFYSKIAGSYRRQQEEYANITPYS